VIRRLVQPGFRLQEIVHETCQVAFHRGHGKRYGGKSLLNPRVK
jgi:hypothetical protein